ncbi:MAG: GNAT family N-acetyltransferase [Verrucomicrobia bacterium]|nr:GNAT family N-acetyltransferase [Verrucomicrobiota bacterium]
MSARPHSSCDIVPACDVPLSRQRQIFNRAFDGYVAGTMKMNAEQFSGFLMRQGADLLYSRFVRVDQRLVGVGYINRFGNVARLAGMGVTPQGRGTGAVDLLMERLLAEARERQDHVMTLECFEQNPRALKVYQRHGFEIVGRMPGWRRSGPVAGGSGDDGPFREIPLLEALRWPHFQEYPNVAWPACRHLLGKTAPGVRAFVQGDVCIVLTAPDVSPVRVVLLLSGHAEHANWPQLRAALAALTRRFPERSWTVPPVLPDDLGREVFAPLGFEPEPLNQVLMTRAL